MAKAQKEAPQRIVPPFCANLRYVYFNLRRISGQYSWNPVLSRYHGFAYMGNDECCKKIARSSPHSAFVLCFFRQRSQVGGREIPAYFHSSKTRKFAERAGKRIICQISPKKKNFFELKTTCTRALSGLKIIDTLPYRWPRSAWHPPPTLLLCWNPRSQRTNTQTNRHTLLIAYIFEQEWVNPTFFFSLGSHSLINFLLS